MAAKTGKNGSLKIGATEHLLVTDFAYDTEQDLPDATGTTSGDWAEYAAGVKAARFTFTANYDAAGGAAGKPPDFSDTVATFELQTDDTPMETISGNCFIGRTSRRMLVRGIVSYTGDALVQGEPTIV